MRAPDALDWKQGFIFSALGIVGALAKLPVGPWSPDRIQLWGFAVVLVIAGTLMLQGTAIVPGWRRAGRTIAPLLVAGRSDRGDGGPFHRLLRGRRRIPGGTALALVMGMSMYRATATALLVITLNSAVALVPRAVKPSISPPLSSSPRSC